MSRQKLLSVTFALCFALVAVAPAQEKLLQEKLLYEGKSSYTLILVTENDQGLRTLSFEKIADRQSVVKVGDPGRLELDYTRAMIAGLAFVGEPRRVLVIGLGGGSIPAFLHKHYPKTMIDVVDIDPGVVKVAKEYFGFREDATMRVHVDDGRRFIENCKNPYDIIFLDAYGSENIPYHLATREFLAAARRALTPKGVVVGNIWSRHANRLHDSMIRTYADVFDALYILNVENCGNEILLATPYRPEMNRDSLGQRAGAVSKEKQFPFDMNRIVNYGYRRAETEELRAPALTDKKE